MKRWLAMLTLFFAFSSLHAVRFQFDNEAGRKYRIKSLTEQDIYLNGDFHSRRAGMNKATLEVLRVTNNYAQYRGKYYHFSKDVSINEPFKLMEIFDTTFFRDKQGRTIISSKYFMPAVRGIPTFPTNDIQAGDSWIAKGEEIHEGVFRVYNNIRFDMDVYYKYLGEEQKDGKMLSKLSIDYHVFHYPKDDPSLLSFTGYSHSIFYWDRSISAPHSYYEDLSFLVTLRNGESVLYRGNSEAVVEVISDLTNSAKQALVAELSNTVSQTPAMKVTNTDDGIIVNLGNILFDVNQATLKQDALDVLEKLAEILRKHPERDIEVSGHTDNTGRAEWNQQLSEHRAKAVSDYLMKKGVASHRISYIGYASSRPVASNSTEAGRTLNRRVEIKIITKE